MDASFDEAEQHIAEADEMLEEYLEQVRGRLKCKRGIVYVSLNKDSHVLELPEVYPLPVCGVQYFTASGLQIPVTPHKPDLSRLASADGFAWT